MNIRKLLAIGTFLAVVAAVSALANQTGDSTKPVAGTSQLQLAQQWRQWALNTPAASNPLLDSTGAFANSNNDGPVFFVAGNVGGSTTRSFTAPAGKPIYVPLVDAIDIEVSADGCNVQCPSSIMPGVGGATNLHATLDGQDLLTFPSFRQTSTSCLLRTHNVSGFGLLACIPSRSVEAHVHESPRLDWLPCHSPLRS